MWLLMYLIKDKGGRTALTNPFWYAPRILLLWNLAARIQTAFGLYNYLRSTSDGQVIFYPFQTGLVPNHHSRVQWRSGKLSWSGVSERRTWKRVRLIVFVSSVCAAIAAFTRILIAFSGSKNDANSLLICFWRSFAIKIVLCSHSNVHKQVVVADDRFVLLSFG